MDNIESIRKAAKQGDAEAQYRLGIWYYDGWGTGYSEIDRNRAEAIKWFRKAAEQGLADAQFILGVWYDLGGDDLGGDIEEDAHEAAKWLLQAAIQGHKLAKLYLGPGGYEFKDAWDLCRLDGVQWDDYKKFLCFLGECFLKPNTKNDENDLTREANFSLCRIEDMIGFQKIKEEAQKFEEEAQKFEKQAQKQTERCNFAMVLCGILLVLGFFIIGMMQPWGAIVLWGFLALVFWRLVKS